MYPSLWHPDIKKWQNHHLNPKQSWKSLFSSSSVFCCTIYSTSGQTASENACASDKFDKPCLKKCTFELKNKKPCCEITRCTKCWKDVGLSKCGPTVQGILQAKIAGFEIGFSALGCTESDRYPSTKCLYHFYPAWFYVVPLLILAAIGGVVAVVVLRRRRRFPAMGQIPAMGQSPADYSVTYHRS